MVYLCDIMLSSSCRREIVLNAILQKAKQILLLTQDKDDNNIDCHLEISDKHDKGEYVGVQSDSDMEENKSSGLWYISTFIRMRKDLRVTLSQ